MTPIGDELLALLGKPVDDPLVEEALVRLGITWRPEIRAGKRNDWVSSGNLELGFEDSAWFYALDALPSGAAPVLNQLCFYAPGAGTARVVAPAFGIEYGWDRALVRSRLSPLAQARRFSHRDVFEVGSLNVVVTFNVASKNVDSVLVLAPPAKRLAKADPALGFAELAACFGREWYDPLLRSRLYSLADDEGVLSQIKKHGSCDLIREAAVRLLYQRGEQTWVFAACEIYRDRVRDACDWAGEMPFGVSFHDLRADVSAKLGRPPVSENDGDLESTGTWSVGEQRVVVTFDNIVNLVSSITVGGASYWDR